MSEIDDERVQCNIDFKPKILPSDMLNGFDGLYKSAKYHADIVLDAIEEERPMELDDMYHPINTFQEMLPGLLESFTDTLLSQINTSMKELDDVTDRLKSVENEFRGEKNQAEHLCLKKRFEPLPINEPIDWTDEYPCLDLFSLYSHPSNTVIRHDLLKDYGKWTVESNPEDFIVEINKNEAPKAFFSDISDYFALATESSAVSSFNVSSNLETSQSLQQADFDSSESSARVENKAESTPMKQDSLQSSLPSAPSKPQVAPQKQTGTADEEQEIQKQLASEVNDHEVFHNEVTHAPILDEAMHKPSFNDDEDMARNDVDTSVINENKARIETCEEVKTETTAGAAVKEEISITSPDGEVVHERADSTVMSVELRKTEITQDKQRTDDANVIPLVQHTVEPKVKKQIVASLAPPPIPVFNTVTASPTIDQTTKKEKSLQASSSDIASKLAGLPPPIKPPPPPLLTQPPPLLTHPASKASSKPTAQPQKTIKTAARYDSVLPDF